MKKLNIFLLIVLLLLIAFLVLFFVGGTLNAQVHTITAPAGDHADAFASIQNVLSTNTAPLRFTGEIPADAAGCTLVDTTITLTNRGLFPAEWIDVSVAGQPGDIAVYSLSGEGGDIPARSAGQINLKLITAGPADAERAITLTYYVYGLQRTLTVTG